MSAGVRNIGHPAGLSPKTATFGNDGETYINVDGVIELARSIDTPQAKQIYKLFRKHFSAICLARNDLSETEKRQEALFAALAELGVHVTLRPAPEGGAA